jgi:2-oxoglutarate/2-oxoacid ferredoxin oxidoreductase subunit alpha
MAEKTYTIKIAGPAGMGIKSIGQLFSKILIAHGFNLADYSEYPSLVRGGHNTYQITFSLDKVFAPHHQVDMFFSINSGHWQQHTSEFTPKTLIFSDEENNKKIGKGIFSNLPLKTLAGEVGSPLVVNSISLGVAVYLFGLDINLTKTIVCGFYCKLSDFNARAIQAGFNYAETNFSKLKFNLKSKINLKRNVELYDGNESFSWGFLAGGGNFYAAYPMTPATGALHFLAAKQENNSNLRVIHAEDEIGVANMAAGAVFAGARAAVGTSGGGFALMNEAVSFCGVTEIGLVFYLASRPGPASGLPTWTAQGDLMHAIYSGHGEFPKVVIAPGDLQESFEMGYQSLNLAAQLQTPIIVVSDKFLAESGGSLKDLSDIKVKIETGDIENKPNEDFARYKFTKNGVSPKTIPGTPNGQFLANSYEHDEYGFATEDSAAADKMFAKRQSKNKLAIKLAPKANFFGNQKAKKLIISWGSTKGPILEALKNLPNKIDFAFLQLKTLWPINPDIQNIIAPFKEIIVIENNGTSQMTTLLKSKFNFNPTNVYTKNDGRPFFPEEIIKFLKNKN